jgi:hypothetical protein
MPHASFGGIQFSFFEFRLWLIFPLCASVRARALPSSQKLECGNRINDDEVIFTKSDAAMDKARASMENSNSGDCIPSTSNETRRGRLVLCVNLDEIFASYATNSVLRSNPEGDIPRDCVPYVAGRRSQGGTA